MFVDARLVGRRHDGTLRLGTRFTIGLEKIMSWGGDESVWKVKVWGAQWHQRGERVALRADMREVRDCWATVGVEDLVVCDHLGGSLCSGRRLYMAQYGWGSSISYL